MIAVM